MRAVYADQDAADQHADERYEHARDLAHDPTISGPAQWRMAPSAGYAVVELDGQQVGPQVAIAEALTVVRWLNLGGLRDTTNNTTAGHAGEEQA